MMKIVIVLCHRKSTDLWLELMSIPRRCVDCKKKHVFVGLFLELC